MSTNNLEKILKYFIKAKEKIKSKVLFKHESKNLEGIEMVIKYSEVIEYIVKELFNLTADQLKTNKGIAAFLYGSSGRKEMISESDLDVLLVYEVDSEKYINFKKIFKKFFEPFKFCKIDIPEWGTIEDLKIFAEKSITEGNQVLESRFIYGDENIKNKVNDIQNKFETPKRMMKNIIFQKFYFDQYFKQRVRNGAINIKYCDGGSRDYLFIYWFDQLMKKKYNNWDKSSENRPAVEQGLYNLYKNGLLNAIEFSKAMEAFNFNLILRNEILLINKGTEDEGLTFLDEKTLKSVYERLHGLMKRYNIRSPKDLAKYFDIQRFHIAKIKKKIWDLTIKEISKELEDPYWDLKFRKAYHLKTNEKERATFLDEDLLIKIATIWGASQAKQIQLFREICKREKDSNSWEIQASIVASPICDPDYLHYIATGIGKEKGYGYILRIISRNPNVRKKTLEAIANDTTIEQRYSQCAKAALLYGKESANHQV